MAEKILAALTLLVCLVLLVRMGLNPRLRRRLDHAGVQTWAAVRHLGWRLRHWRGHRKSAVQQAEAAIRRAQGEVAREGNVYRPKNFRGPRKPH